ncbi:MAG: hypothetical protein LBT96_05485 [Campylobacteraceae bacterium]|jgi:hypothetical protein|nr:hypothetical protein [Campylobacteraceae bacterium]
MRFKVKILAATIVAGLFCNTLTAVESGFVTRLGYGLINIKEEFGGSTVQTHDTGTLDIYLGYRMQNLQFGFSYVRADFFYEVRGLKDYSEATGVQFLASGAYVFENIHDKIKPFLGLGFGKFYFTVDDGKPGAIYESGTFGTANAGVNVEYEHFFYGAELRERIFGGAGTGDYEVIPQDTYMFYVGYKF